VPFLDLVAPPLQYTDQVYHDILNIERFLEWWQLQHQVEMEDKVKELEELQDMMQDRLRKYWECELFQSSSHFKTQLARMQC
jgi:hypothetical protein